MSDVGCGVCHLGAVVETSTLILSIKWNFVRGSFLRVRRIFLDGPVYGERSVFCSVCAVAYQRGEEDHGHKHGHGHGHHEKDARRDTNNTPHTSRAPVCCCELIAHSAPIPRIARAPELV